jgi:glyoxylase-like metal-dependent hydrolase (beta-lactamase superfamily II)
LATPFDEVGDRVYRRRYPLLDQNIGVVLGSSGALVIDTRSVPSHGREIADELRDLTALPVMWVINTHWHWDHVLGNSVFGEAEIWGHRRCREVMASDPEAIKAPVVDWLGEGAAGEVDQTTVVPPTSVFDHEVAIDLGDRVVELWYRGKGHTDADLTVRVDDVLFAGDLLEEGVPPYFGDSYPLQWPETMAAHASDDPPRLAVPGHGDVMDSAAVAEQIEELQEVARRCAAARTAGELEMVGAPYPEDVMRLAMARTLEVGPA